MRCKSCDYPLWSIRARQCPECGREFVPSEFEFAANAVEFRCPHCGQCYFGTDDRGHLMPRDFDCVRCGARIGMDEMVLHPGEGVMEEQTVAPILPWLDRKKKRTAAWRTIGMAMFQPRRMMDVTPAESSVGRAWWFYALVMTLVSVLSGLALFGVGFGMGGGLVAGLLFGVMGFGAGVFLLPALWGAVSHGLMRALGAGPRHTIGRTYQGICYSSGVMIPSAVPCLGFYALPVTMVWWVVSASLAVPWGQGAHPGRGALAVVLPPLIVLLSVFGLIAWGVSRTMTLTTAGAGVVAGGGVAGAPALRVGDGTTSDPMVRGHEVYRALISHAHRTGSAPTHGVGLLQETLDWYAVSPGVYGSSEALGLNDEGTWAQMSPGRRAEVAARLREAAGENRMAHRLGHVVFTYDGIDLSGPQDPGLWIFIYWPDPGGVRMPPEQGDETPVVWSAGGAGLSIAPTAFDAALEAQNVLRAAHGLPALPHPRDVRTTCGAEGEAGGS